MDINSTPLLNNGIEIPRLGPGDYRSEPGIETENAVICALEEIRTRC